MSASGLMLVALSAVLTVASNLLVRLGVGRAGGFSLSAEGAVKDLLRLAREPSFDVGIVLYASASVVWFRVLSTENLNISYPLLVSMTFVLVTFMATVLFHEPLSWVKVAGLGVILAGIVLVSRV